jgi:hypothetical protein
MRLWVCIAGLGNECRTSSKDQAHEHRCCKLQSNDDAVDGVATLRLGK